MQHHNHHQHDSDNHTVTSVSRSHKAGSTMSRTQSLVRSRLPLACFNRDLRRRPSVRRPSGGKPREPASPMTGVFLRLGREPLRLFYPFPLRQPDWED